MNITGEISHNIFRGYDIRGIYGEDLNIDVAFTIGKAYGTILKNEYSKDMVIVGQDNRVSSPMLSNALIQGIVATGVNVIYLGTVTSSMLYYANELYNIHAGVMVTASHNPKEYNGFKIAFDKKGEICGYEIQGFKEFTLEGNFLNVSGKNLGKVETVNINKQYADMIVSKFNFKNKLKVVVDCGNGTASIIVRDIFSKLNLKVEYIFCDSDPDFPNHHPDPAEAKNMEQLQKKVLETKSDIGIAFDGDADRVGVVDEKGNIVTSDYYLAIMSKYILPTVDVKKVIFDVSCSKTLADEIRKNGGEPICYKTGNSYIKREMLDQGMLFGGEISGHTFFKDKFYGFDDGVYAGLRMIEVIDNETKKLSEIADTLEKYYSTPIIKVKVDDSKKARVVESVKEYCINKGFDTNTIDGARVEFNDGFAIVRMSNTTPNLTLRFEAQTEERLNEIKEEFVNVVNDIISKHV